jgi:ADP-heptose:LPS heptosyltransferase
MRPPAEPPVTTHPSHWSARVFHLGAKKRAAAFAMGLGATVLRAAAASRRFNSRAVLILEPFGMGDMISYQPLIRALRANNCDVRICAKLEWRALYPEIGCWVPARIPWSSYAEGTKYSLAEYASPAFRGFMRQLRDAGRGCIGLDTRGDIRSIVLLYLAGCRQVLTLSNYLDSDLNNFPGAARRVRFCPDLRRWELNSSFLEPLQLQHKVGPPRFPHLSRPRVPISARELGVLPIAPWKGKWWDRQKWSELISSVTAKGWKVTGLCGPGQSKVAAHETAGAVQIVECGSIEHWAVELQKFSAIVTVDTGGMHLADALEVPVIALFGQGLLPLWGPSGPQSRVLSRQNDPDFVPCQQIEKNASKGREFMARIPVEEVVSALGELEQRPKIGVSTD